MKSESRIRTKFQAKSTIRAKILDKSAIRGINKIRQSAQNIRQIQNLSEPFFRRNTTIRKPIHPPLMLVYVYFKRLVF